MPDRISGPGTDLRTMEKATLITHLNTLLEQRASSLKAELATTLEARNSDTKSSAGDKHEVGRAMVQQELDQLEGRLAAIRSMQQQLARVAVDAVHQQVGFGSVVTTEQGHYFIAISLGAIELAGERCFAISSASPIGEVLMGRRPGDAITFNGKRMTIASVR
jgi:transcription elongation GreA/GreB family factor